MHKTFNFYVMKSLSTAPHCGFRSNDRGFVTNFKLICSCYIIANMLLPCSFINTDLLETGLAVNDQRITHPLYPFAKCLILFNSTLGDQVFILCLFHYFKPVFIREIV